MQQSTSLPHIPEPREVAAWLASIPRRLAAYWAQPQTRILWGLVALAALLRLAQLDLIPLRGEQVAVLNQAASLTDASGAPQVAFPPLLAYLLALPVQLNRDPRLAAGLLATLNVGAVALLYATARRHLSARAALLASAMLATAPWAVLLARRIAPEALLIPLATAFTGALLSAVHGENRWGWTLAGLLAGLAGYTASTGWALAVVLVVVAACYYRRVSWPHLLMGGLVWVAMVANHLYSLGRSQPGGWARLWLSAAAPSAEPSWWRALRWGQWLASGRGLSWLAQPSAATWTLERGLSAILPALAGWLWLAALPVLAWWAARSWGRWQTDEDTSRYVIPALGLWLPLICLGLGGLGLQGPTSLAVTLPAGCLGMGLLADRGLTALAGVRWGGLATLTRSPRRPLLRESPGAWRPWFAIAGWALLAALAGWNVYATAYLARFTVEHDARQGYGVPLRFWRLSAELAARQMPAAGADQLWLVAPEQHEDESEAVGILRYLLGPRVKTAVLAQPAAGGALLPAERPSLYLLTGPAPWPETLTGYLGGQDVGKVLMPAGVPELTVRTLRARPAEEMLGLAPVRALRSFDAGLRLVGFGWPADAASGATVTLSTYWTFWDVPSAERATPHTLRVALLDANGTVAAQAQGLSLAERSWEEGLLLEQWHLLNLAGLPPGRYILALSLSRDATATPNLVVDEQGQPQGGAIFLGPVSVAAPSTTH